MGEAKTFTKQLQTHKGGQKQNVNTDYNRNQENRTQDYKNHPTPITKNKNKNKEFSFSSNEMESRVSPGSHAPGKTLVSEKRVDSCSLLDQAALSSKEQHGFTSCCLFLIWCPCTAACNKQQTMNGHKMTWFLQMNPCLFLVVLMVEDRKTVMTRWRMTPRSPPAVA